MTHPDDEAIYEGIVLWNTYGRVAVRSGFATNPEQLATALCMESMSTADAKAKEEIDKAQRSYDEAKDAAKKANEALDEQLQKVNATLYNVNLGQNVADAGLGGLGLYAAFAAEGPAGWLIGAGVAIAGITNDYLRPSPVSIDAGARQVIDVANVGGDLAEKAGEVVVRAGFKTLGAFASALQSFHSAMEAPERIAMDTLEDFSQEIDKLNPSWLQKVCGIDKEKLKALANDAIDKKKALADADRALQAKQNKWMNSGSETGTCIEATIGRIRRGVHGVYMGSFYDPTE